MENFETAYIMEYNGNKYLTHVPGNYRTAHSKIFKIGAFNKEPIENDVNLADFAIKGAKFHEVSPAMLSDYKHADVGPEYRIDRLRGTDRAKSIRFIDRHYKTRFYLKNGGYIRIKSPIVDITRKCEYVDYCHVKVGGELYHICQFAEAMERAGAEYGPA